MNIDPIIIKLCDDIIKICSPFKIILISQKFNTKHKLKSFKLCVIVDGITSTAELEGKLYLETECEIPYDLIIYNKDEWESFITDRYSFAGGINESGEVIYVEK